MLKIGLVLGAGGARGLAHIGVLKVLEREGIRPDLIVGCSAGAIVGAMYAQNPNVEWVEKRMREFLTSMEYDDLELQYIEGQGEKDHHDFMRQIARNLMRRVLLNIVASRTSLLKNDKFGNVIRFLVKPGDIRDTQIPFGCVATDLVSGKPIYFTEGDIQLAVQASSSIPGYLPPVRYDSKVLVDGAVVYNLPIPFARKMGANFIVTVDVKRELRPINDFKNVFDIILRASDITSYILHQEISQDADISIQPEVGEYMWYEFKRLDELIHAGEEAAYAKLDQIKDLAHHRKRKLWAQLKAIIKV